MGLACGGGERAQMGKAALAPVHFKVRGGGAQSFSRVQLCERCGSFFPNVVCALMGNDILCNHLNE